MLAQQARNPGDSVVLEHLWASVFETFLDFGP